MTDFGTPVGELVNQDLDGTPFGLTVPAGAQYAVLQVDSLGAYSDTTRVARYTVDGTTTPTAAIGQFLGDGDYIVLQVGQFSNFSMITAEASVAGKVFIQFYKGMPNG